MATPTAFLPRTAPLNQEIWNSPRRGNHFSLSPGERVGVRASVDHLMLLGFSERKNWNRNLSPRSKQGEFWK